MGVSVNDDVMTGNRPLLHVPDVVDEKDALTADLEAVWRFEQFRAEGGLRARP
jgi:hypothetical protein